MDPEDREAVEWRTRMEMRVQSLEDDRRKAMWVLGAAAIAVFSQMWDQIKAVIFHGK